MSTPHNLTPRQKAFADLYISGTPAGRAWSRAGYRATDNAAEAQASAALRKPKFKAYIKAERARLDKEGEFERSHLVGYLVQVIRTPVGQLDGGSALVQEYIEENSETGTRTKIKIANKLQACSQLAQIMGWNKPQEIKLDFKSQLTDLVSRIRRS